MNGNKKALPRGYNEILNFIRAINEHHLPEDMEQADISTGVHHFLDTLFRRRLAVVRCLLEILLDFHNQERELSISLWLLSQCPAEKATKILEEFMAVPQIPDRLKRKVLLVLETVNSNKVIDWVKYFSNKDSLAEYALNCFLDAIGYDGENLNSAFSAIADQDNEFYQALIANLTYRTDEESLWVLGILAEFPNTIVAENAIQALGYRKSPLAYELLDNLITQKDDRNGVKAKALHRLAQAGILHANTRLMTPHKCFLSWIDGCGNRMLVISRRTGRGRLFMVSFMLHEDIGLQACTISNDITTYDMDSFISNLEKKIGLKQIDYTMGVKLVEDSLWKIVTNKHTIPPNFLLARRVFGVQKLQPQAYQVSLNDMGIQYVQKKIEELTTNSDQLLHEQPFFEWTLEEPEVINFIKVRPSILSGKKVKKETISLFIKNFIEPRRNRWKERFLSTAEFLYRTSQRIYRDQIDICLAIYFRILENANLDTIPFMTILAQMSIQKACESYNISRGLQIEKVDQAENPPQDDNRPQDVEEEK